MKQRSIQAIKGKTVHTVLEQGYRLVIIFTDASALEANSEGWEYTVFTRKRKPSCQKLSKSLKGFAVQ